MQSVSYRIWTRVAVSISYDDNDYTTGTFNYVVFNYDVINYLILVFALPTLDYYYTSWEFFIPVLVCSLSPVSVIASFIRFLRLFSVFWPILIIQLLGWFGCFLRFSALLVPIQIFWGAVPTAIIGINVTPMLHRFFSSLARSKYLSFFSLSFISPLTSTGTAKSTIRKILFFSC